MSPAPDHDHVCELDPDWIVGKLEYEEDRDDSEIPGQPGYFRASRAV
jgi:hypothetical protein